MTDFEEKLFSHDGDRATVPGEQEPAPPDRRPSGALREAQQGAARVLVGRLSGERIAPTDPPSAAAPAGLRERVGAATGTDLSQARIHVGGASDSAARAIGARAFATGREVHVAADHYRPGTPDGDRLIAHELVHVAQQAGGSAPPQRKADPRDCETISPSEEHSSASALSEPGDPAERQADQIADAVVGGGPIARVAPVSAGDRVHRLTDPAHAKHEQSDGGGAPSTLSLEQLVAALQGARISVAATREDPELAGAGLDAADVDQDGMISGDVEWSRLFLLLGGGKGPLRLRDRGGRPTSAAMMLAAIARRSRSAALKEALGPISSEGTVVLLGMSDTSLGEAQSLRRQTPVTLITDVSPTDRRDVVRQIDGREVDLRWDDQLDGRSIGSRRSIRSSIRIGHEGAPERARRGRALAPPGRSS